MIECIYNLEDNDLGALIIVKMMNFKKDVVYYFDEMIGTYHYAFAHPMKPLRVAMTD